MKKTNLLVIAFLVLGVTLVACKKEKEEEKPTPTPTPTPTTKSFVDVSGEITGKVKWTADKIWRLKGFVRVVEGAELTIEPGTVIVGERQSKGTLVVQMGGKIFAEGTADKPIVFTSEKEPGFRNPGDWGGVVICGRAKNNVTAKTGQPVELEGGYGGFHGGNNDDDNSGVLKYVRIEYAGVPINTNEEVNSLTLGSVGRGTKIENVMCSYGLDDAFEFFGGTVNCKNLIAYRCLDDNFDVDLGYSGNVQFGVVIAGPMLADQSGSNGFEVDNNGSGSNDQPYTSGVFANISIFGPKGNREEPISLQYRNAAQLRRNSRISIYNSFMTAYPTGLYIDDEKAGSGQAFLDDELQIRNVILAGVENWGGNGYGGAGTVFVNDVVGKETVDGVERGKQHPTEPRGSALKAHDNFPGGKTAMENQFKKAEFNNQLMKSWKDAGINENIFEDGVPTLTLKNNSPLANAAKWDNTPKANNNFFEKVSFIGAFGSTDWTAGWANWNCHVTKYW